MADAYMERRERILAEQNAKTAQEKILDILDLRTGGRGRGLKTGAGKPDAGTPKVPAPKAPAPPPPAPAQPPAGPKPADGSGGGYSKKPPRFKDCGKLGKHKDNKKLSKKGELNSDHIPSGAAMKKAYIEKLEKAGVLKELRRSGNLDKVLDRMYENAPTISTPEDVHKDGQTNAGKNKSSRSDRDSRDLKTAVNENTEAIKISMSQKDPGCFDEYSKSAEKLKQFDFDKFFDEQIKGDPAIGKPPKKGK